MIFVGWLIGMAIGGVLAAGLLPALGLSPAIAGVLIVIAGPLGPIIAPFVGILSISIALLIGGMGLLVVTIVAYGLAAVSLGPLPLLGGVVTTNPIELVSRGVIIGLTTAANAVVISAFTGLPILTTVVILFGLLTTIPPVAANRFVFQPLLGLLSWVLPLTWLVMPVGILLFVLNLPFAIAQSGIGAIRFDFLTFTVETSGGALLNFIFSLGTPGTAGFNLASFTFLRLPAGTALATVQTGFAVPGVPTHETGHTLTIAALGGFFGWVNAIDENIPPLARRSTAYGEIIPESHFAPRGFPFLPMW